MSGAASTRPWLTDGIATMIAERTGSATGPLSLAQSGQSTSGQVRVSAPEPIPARSAGPPRSEQAVPPPASGIPVSAPETHFREELDATELRPRAPQSPAPVTQPGAASSGRRWIWPAIAVAGVLVLAVGGLFLVRTLLPAGDDPVDVASGGTSPGVTDADADAEPDSSPAAINAPPAAPCMDPVRVPRETYNLPDDAAASENRKWHATLKTCLGDIEVELDGVSAPTAVAVFVELARGGYYDGTGCHELQTAGPYRLNCGDPTFSGDGNPGYLFGPPENVPDDGVYPVGSLVMRFNGSGYSGAQFSLVYGDSEIPTDSYGHTVFGKVTSGMDILQRVAAQGSNEGNGQPKQPVTVTSIELE
jgi:cyclophilin family peptidyl-prolyl cis-trans isomerase